MEFEEMSFKEIDLKFYFVVGNDIQDMKEVSKDMNLAYANIREYFPEEESIKWIQETECLRISKTDLTKKHIFVLNEFSGDVFDFLQKSKSLIVGPRCLITCLMENASIPLGKSPVFTTAMRNLVVCASGFSVPEKAKLKNLVFWMGGYYVDDLSLNCTHLVSNTVQSNKYEKAALNAIPIMQSEWVYTVWEKNKEETISASSKEFDKYKLPIFYKLNITSSGLANEKRNNLIKLINENGGNYLRSFKSSMTDILIIEKDRTDSDKYQAAIKFKKDCLLPDWIFDSVAKGYAIPPEHYRVTRIKVSTPTKSETSVSISDFNPDGTQLSEISHADLHRTNFTVNESVCSMASTASGKSQQTNSNKPTKKTYKDLLEQINSAQAKKAGVFLDGCSIYLSGFNPEEKEKLNKILNAGGATRYDEISHQLSHIIVGECIPGELLAMRDKEISAAIVTIDWLAESIRQRQPANEEEFLFRAKLPISVEPEAPSPSSKKSLQSMNHSFKKPMAPKKRLQFGQDQTNSNNVEEENLLQQYTNQKAPTIPPPKAPISITPAGPPATGSTDGDSEMCTEDYENLNFFDGLTVYIHDHYDDLYTQLIADCENAGGKLVNEKYRDEVDYVIVPSEVSTDVDSIPVKGKHIVNNLWIEDAIKENKLVEKEYYHAPIPHTADCRPLEGMLIVISLYSANERLFIESLATVLGATKNDVYAKKERPLLICQLPEGAKYNAAVKWGFPVVTSDWLVDCAKQGCKVDMGPYLVGESISREDFSKTISSNSSSGPEGGNDKSLRRNRKTEEPPNENIIRHPRVSELADVARRRSVGSSGDSSPNTPEQKEFNISDFVKEVSTPLRDTLYNVLKEAQDKDTPQSQRLKKLVATPGMKTNTPPTPKFPEFCKTPEVQKRRLAFYDKYYLPIDRNKVRRQSTPLSELKRRLWKEALGDEYVEDFQTQCNTQTQAYHESNDVFACSSANESEQDQNIPSSNFRRLTDFIKTRDEKKSVPEPVEETEAIPQKVDLEMICGTAEEMVGWRDPSESIPIKRQRANGKRYKGIPVFTISCLDENKKERIINQIKQLKGEVCENLINFDPKCTHIVCEKPNRGEKILSCIAAGKWILGLKYIEDSVSAGQFLDEEEYEFGNPKATSLHKLESNEQSIATAAFRWRTKIAHDSTKKSGVFTGFRVILHVHKIEQFQRLITAGGGIVLKLNPPYEYSDDALQATHCLVDLKKSKLAPSDHKALADAGVLVLSMAYLNAYLTSDIEPDYSKYILSL